MQTPIDHFDRIVWSILFICLIAILSVVLLGKRSGPPIEAYYPPDGGEIASTGRVGIQFKRQMNTGTVPEVVFADEAGNKIAGNTSWQQDTLWFTPSTPLKVGTHYTVEIPAGSIRSRDGRELHQSLRWQVQVRRAGLLYMAPVDGPRELWWLDPQAPEAPRQLTSTEGNVFDFGVSPDGELIIFSYMNLQGGSDLWLMDHNGENQRLLVNCGIDRCTEATFSPDSSRIAYSREVAPSDPTQPISPPRLWTADIASGRTLQLYQDSQVLGYGASFSPDGRYLAFFDAAQQGIRILDLTDRSAQVLPSWTGQVGIWSPDASRMLFSEVVLAENQQEVQLWQANVREKSTLQIKLDSAEAGDIASLPVWSADGELLVAGVRPGAGGVSVQLWQFRPDGSDAHALTEDPQYTYGLYRWDPTGQFLVTQRLQLQISFPKPEILLWERASGKFTPLISNATFPAWLP